MKYLFLFVGLLTSFWGSSQSGITFQEGNWSDVLATAERENKLIFLDAYTTWCGPCKMMSAHTFTDAEVGRFFNANFVNAKFDMEKGEGRELARRYEVRAYPTLLFINGNGELVHQGLGYHDMIQFMELGRTALDDKNNLSGMAARYDAGERSAAFLYDYANLLWFIDDPDTDEAAQAYLETQKDWGTEENREFLLSFTNRAQGPMFDYIAANRLDFEEQFGKTQVVNFIQRLVIREVSNSDGSQPALEEMEALINRSFPDVADVLIAHFRMTYYQRAGDIPQFTEAAVHYLDTYGSDDANELNTVAWAFYEDVNDPALLRKAVAWAQRSVELNKNYYNMDTLAALYVKVGAKKKAKRAAEEAIELAKANQDDYQATQQLLEQIERM